MKTFKFIAVGCMFMGSMALSTAQNVKTGDKEKVYETLAQNLVTQCVMVKEGEIVLISGSIRDNELLEDIAVSVRKQGAFPLLTIGSDRLTRKIYTEVPVKYDAQTSQLDMKLLGMVNAIITVETNENPAYLTDIPPERFVAINKAAEPVGVLWKEKNIRGVSLGNGLYPTEAKAKQFGMTMDELTDIFWKGVNVDYPKLETTGKSVKSILMSGKEVHITNSNGTDLKVKIESRPVIVSDGIISPDDQGKGSAFTQTYLPAGEVIISTVPGTAEGKLVVDNTFYFEKEIRGLTLTFSKGKLVSMTAKSGLDPFKAYYDAAEAGKEELTSLDFGINPNVKVKPGSKFVNWVPAGMITVGIGNSIGAGGENNSPFGFGFFIPGCTIDVDGKVLVDKEELKN